MESIYSTKYVHIKSTTVYARRRNWDSLQPPTRRLVCPLPPVSGGRGTLAGEKGVGRVLIPTRGIHCGTLYMYVLCDLQELYTVSLTRFRTYKIALPPQSKTLGGRGPQTDKHLHPSPFTGQFLRKSPFMMGVF